MILKFARPDDRQGSLLLVVGLALPSVSSDSLAEASEKDEEHGLLQHQLRLPV